MLIPRKNCTSVFTWIGGLQWREQAEENNYYFISEIDFIFCMSSHLEYGKLVANKKGSVNGNIPKNHRRHFRNVKNMLQIRNWKNHHHHYPMADNHLSEDVEDGEAEEWEDVLEIVEVRSSNSFHVLIGSSLVQIYQIYLLGGFTTPTGTCQFIS